MTGGYYVWVAQTSDRLGIRNLERIKRAGCTLTSVDHRRIWTNSPVLEQQEEERRAWAKAREIQSCRVLSWGKLFHEVSKEQVERRELDC